MFMQEKIDNAMRILHENSVARKQEKAAQKLDSDQKAGLMEKGDLLAMVISAFLVIFPAVLVALLVIGAICWLFFMH